MGREITMGRQFSQIGKGPSVNWGQQCRPTGGAVDLVKREPQSPRADVQFDADWYESRYGCWWATGMLFVAGVQQNVVCATHCNRPFSERNV